jgi:hypothetical protein
MKKLTLGSSKFSGEEWNNNLSKLCHSCKTVRPLRSSHCKSCNRCVLAYDHHCPYIQNCVGYNNRKYFFLFLISICSLQIITLKIIYISLQENYDHYIYYPGSILVILFLLMTIILLYNTFNSIILNLTGNEMAKVKKYAYLKDNKGNFKNIFSNGLIYNIKYFFHFVQPNQLETLNFLQKKDVDV